MASTARKIPPPAPPNRSGTSMPMRPSSKNLGIRSGSKLRRLVHPWTCGRTSVSANSRTESRNRPSSSDRVVRAVGAAVRRSCIGWAPGSVGRLRCRSISPGLKGSIGAACDHLERHRHPSQRRGRPGRPAPVPPPPPASPGRSSLLRPAPRPSPRARSPHALQDFGRAPITPGTSLARNSALRSETSGQMPATIGIRNCSTRLRNRSS